MKKLFLGFSLIAFAIGIVGCTADPTETTEAPTTEAPTTEETTTEAPTTEPTNELAQGVTDTSILVGNTAAVTGAFAGVGVPFNDAIKAVFEEVNENGGIDGREIEFITYNDEFDATKGVTFTETLVEQDEVFALVGHFGTPTVGATVDYIQDEGVPMVYAATGINALYFEESVGNPVMAVQPIYLTDGRIMTARALTEEVYGTNGDEAFPSDGTIGVLYTGDDVGNSIKAGVEAEMDVLGIAESRVEYISASLDTMSAAVTDASFAGVDVVILAMNQEPFAAALDEMANQSFEVPVFSSYVNADPTYVDPAQYSEDRPIFTNAWVDVFSEEGQAAVGEFATTIAGASFLDETTKEAYLTNSFAIAGYIAARVFIEGLTRVETNGDLLTWSNYISAMEEGPIDIPMGGTVDFSGGKRWGIASMSLLQYYVGDNPATPDETETDFETFNQVQPIETIEEIEAKFE
ncbi:MAG: ABC transporter substrate-binding protein [Candidatus Izemoplasmatales bacterium]